MSLLSNKSKNLFDYSTDNNPWHRPTNVRKCYGALKKYKVKIFVTAWFWGAPVEVPQQGVFLGIAFVRQRQQRRSLLCPILTFKREWEPI